MPKAEMAQEKFCCCAKRKPIELYPLADGRRVAFPRSSESSGIARADAWQLSDNVESPGVGRAIGSRTRDSPWLRVAQDAQRIAAAPARRRSVNLCSLCSLEACGKL